jgi:hypothetical protein
MVYIALLPAAILFITLAAPGTKKQKLGRSLLFTAMFVLVASPWCLVNIARHGNLHNLNYANIAFGAFDRHNSWLMFDTYSEKYTSALSIFLSHPKEIAWHFATNIVNFPIEIVVKQGYFAGLMAIIGFLVLLRRPSLERLALVFGGVALLLLTFLAWLNPRFFIPVIPLVMLFAAHLMLHGTGRTASPFWPRDASTRRFFSRIPLRRMLTALAITVAVAATIIRVPSDFAHANVPDERAAGRFLEENTPENTAILTSSRNLAWYAKRPFVSMNCLRNVTSDNLEEAVKNTGIRVFVYTRRHSLWTHPQLEYLLNPDDARVPESFHLIYRSMDDWPVVVYRVD